VDVKNANECCSEQVEPEQKLECKNNQSQTDLLSNALGKLVRRLDAVHSDPSYVGVWALAQNHVGPYKGLTYEKELNEARQALADDKASEGGVDG